MMSSGSGAARLAAIQALKKNKKKQQQEAPQPPPASAPTPILASSSANANAFTTDDDGNASPPPTPAISSTHVVKRDQYVDDSDAYVTEDEEDEEDYKPGGYHPVRIGDSFKDGRYRVVKKLGWGHFSTVWLAEDVQARRYVAMKVVKSAKHYCEAAEDEIKLLERVRHANPAHPGQECVVAMLDSFIHQGPFGRHIVMVFEVLGENLLTMIRRYDHKGLPVPVVKRVAKQLLEALDYLHRECGILHTDIKPENVLQVIDERKFCRRFGLPLLNGERGLARSLSSITLEQPQQQQQQKRRNDGDGDESPRKRPNSPAKNVVRQQQQQPSSSSSISPNQSITSGSTDSLNNSATRLHRIRTKLVDLGNACWVDHHFTNSIQTRQYRSPEAIIVADYDTMTDMWSVGCLVFELLTGDYLFDPHRGDQFSKDDDHLAQMIELLYPFPKGFALSGKYSKDFFDRQGKLKHIKKLKVWPLREVLSEKYGFDGAEVDGICQFLQPMLEIVPSRRATAQEMLNHRWLLGVE